MVQTMMIIIGAIKNGPDLGGGDLLLGMCKKLIRQVAGGNFLSNEIPSMCLYQSAYCQLANFLHL